MKRITTIAALIFGLVGWAGSAQAATIATLTVDGLDFTLDRELAGFDLVPGDGENDTFTYMLTLDTAGYTGAVTDYIRNVNLKVTGTNDEDAGELSSTTAPGTWQFLFGGLNNDGCQDELVSGFFCAQSEDGLAVLDGSVYTWTFNIDITGNFQTPHLKAQWFDQNDVKLNQISTDMVPTGTGTGTGGTGGGTTGGTIPEPASLLLLGSGLAAATMGMRRRRR